MKAPADSVSDGNSLPVSQMAIKISHGRRAERALWGFFYKGTDFFHEGSVLYLIPSLCGLGFQHTNFGVT